MQLKKYYTYSLVAAVFCGIIYSCSKMDDTYDDFIKDGEIVYTGRVDSVRPWPGNNRIYLSMLLISDPKISKVKVFWNTGSQSDSTEKEVQRSAGIDTVWFSFNKMPEGTFTFNIYTFDKLGHKSVKTDIIGDVYGEKYIAQLVNRAIKSGSYDGAGKQAVIKWFGVGTDVIGEEIIYTDSSGVTRKQFEMHQSIKDSLTILPAYKKGNSFQFRTLYKPTPYAIDTFYSNYESRIVP
jgi:hypothetical protein